MGVVFRGESAELLVARTRCAARLKDWTLHGLTLTATVQEADAYRISQQPIAFVVHRKTGQVRWPVLPNTLQITGASLTATLGPPEMSHGSIELCRR